MIGRVLPALSQLARLIEVVSTVANCREREARKKERENEREKGQQEDASFLTRFSEKQERKYDISIKGKDFILSVL